MFTRTELMDAIDELEKTPSTFQNCQKLATFYSLYDHLYGDKRPVAVPVEETIRVIDDYGDTEFFQSVSGADAERVFYLLNELMDTVKVLQPRLYEATINELKVL